MTFWGWENSCLEINSSQVQSDLARIQIQLCPCPKQVPLTVSQQGHVPGIGAGAKVLDEMPLMPKSIQFSTDQKIDPWILWLFYWIEAIWGVIFVWLHFTKFSQTDLFEASNYLFSMPMPEILLGTCSFHFSLSGRDY